MKNLLLVLGLSFISLNAAAGEIAKDAIITKLGNSSDGSADFYIRITGGTGVCANSLIKFPESKQASEASNNQAFSLALTAMTTGKKIRLANFQDNNCHGANFIEMIN